MLSAIEQSRARNHQRARESTLRKALERAQFPAVLRAKDLGMRAGWIPGKLASVDRKLYAIWTDELWRQLGDTETEDADPPSTGTDG